MNEKTIAAPGSKALSPLNPFTKQNHESLAHGTVAIESERAIADVQAAVIAAKKFQRDPARCFEMLVESCSRKGLAAEAFYSYPRGTETVTGPSIRLAEELARVWGNLEYGLRELSNTDGVSEMEAYCWDLETNVRSKQQFTVKHTLDKKGGPKVLTDERDIYEKTANSGARRLRSRILAILPADFVDSAVELCKQTLAQQAGKETPAERRKKMIAAFAPLGVTVAMLQAKLGKPNLDSLTPDDFVTLTGVHRSITEGAKVSDHFETPTLEAPFPAKILTPPVDVETAATNEKTKKKTKAEEKKDPAPPPVGEQTTPNVEPPSKSEVNRIQPEPRTEEFFPE